MATTKRASKEPPLATTRRAPKLRAQLRKAKRLVSELTAAQCTAPIEPGVLDFETTAELGGGSLIRQERVVASMDLGLRLQRHNYHLYVAGPSGTGRRTLVHEMLATIAPDRPVPCDWVYLHNFEDQDTPLAVSLPAGEAVALRRHLDDFLSYLLEALPKAFRAPDQQVRLQQTISRSNGANNEAFVQLRRAAQELGFDIRMSEEGELDARPLVDGEPLEDDDIFTLPDDQRQAIELAREGLEPVFRTFVEATSHIEAEAQHTIETLQREVGEQIVAGPIDVIRERFSAGDEKLVAFIDHLTDRILDDLEAFMPDAEHETGPHAIDPFAAFHANVVVDNSKTRGAPVVVERQPTFYRLFGRIDRRVEQGIYSTDHTMIRAGSIARANGGYLVCHAEDVLNFPGVWETLKLTLRNREVAIVDLGETSGVLPTSGMKPEPIALDVKLILLGSNATYHALFELDEDFRKIFQVKADFDHDIERTPKSVARYVSFVAGSAEHCECRPLHRDAVAAVLDHSSRVAESQRRLTLRANVIGNLLVEANFFAHRDGAAFIAADHIERAIRGREMRSSLIADKMHEDLTDGMLLIEADGSRVGVVNGLAVLTVGEHSFGRPFRVTARCFAGESGVVNIEHEVKLSGDVHDKGVHILSGFLGDRFAQRHPLAVTATVAFEQSYSYIEGDSAASTWLFGILSALSGVPIQQGIAVTGSVNQLGEIQPVGGVTEKVEGFYRFCECRGFTGRQGVVMPARNVSDLVLDREVRDAISDGRFHVWPVETVEEGLEVLTGVVAGTADAAGDYDPRTLMGRAAARLEALRRARDRGDELR